MFKYVGDGGYLPGIPARDIPDDEAKERGWAETLKGSPAYEHEADAAEKPKAGGKPAEGGD
jgi:hypothetical protein